MVFSLNSSTSIQRECVTVDIIDDNLFEGTENFFIELQSDPLMPGDVSLGTNSLAVVSILDSDTPGKVYIIILLRITVDIALLPC